MRATNMETWGTAILTLAIYAIFNLLFRFIFKHNKLPPGPLALPFIGNPIWLFKPFSELESILRNFHSQYGPVLTLYFGNTPSIFIASHSVSHQALVQNGAVFADRFPVMETIKLITSNQRNISTAFYGPLWRVLRRNLTAELLHPSRLKSHAPSRKWALDLLIHRLVHDSGSVKVPIEHIRLALYSLATAMCFGERFEGEKIEKIQAAQRGVLLNINKFTDINFWPVKLGKILFRKRWEELYQLRRNQDELLLPLIKARKKVVKESINSPSMEINSTKPIPYVDTLFDLEITDEEQGKRKLVDDELISLCTEFLDAITDTTAATLQWIMANLVKYPHIQEKLYSEINEVMREKKEIEEEDLEKMGYLKAVVMEGLRRHPPGHLLLPHKVMEETVLEGGYIAPKGASVNFMVADMGWDPKVWPDPMEFDPERFVKKKENGGVEVEVDITGSKEIKMMPFGAGRRICPGYMLGLLHLEYFVSKMVWNLKLTAVDDVDLTEKQESAIVMKKPLRCQVTARHV